MVIITVNMGKAFDFYTGGLSLSLESLEICFKPLLSSHSYNVGVCSMDNNGNYLRECHGRKGLNDDAESERKRVEKAGYYVQTLIQYRV
jgi:hypothetical protein